MKNQRTRIKLCGLTRAEYVNKIDYDSRWDLPHISHAFPMFWNHDK
jgi:hypothetical protein